MSRRTTSRVGAMCPQQPETIINIALVLSKYGVRTWGEGVSGLVCVAHDGARARARIRMSAPTRVLVHMHGALGRVCTKVKVSSYISQYPVFRTVQLL